MGNWSSIIAPVLSFITFGLLVIVWYYIKEIPKMHKDLLHDMRESRIDELKDERKYTNNRKLQIESYYREQGGQHLEQLFREWTDVLFDLEKAAHVTPKKFTSLAERTVIYGSDLTIKILSAYQEHNYGTTDKDSGTKGLMYVALLICSLKQDFTGFKVDPDTLLKIKINDFSSQPTEVMDTLQQIEKEVGWE